MTKLVNLDDLGAIERTVKWKGKPYKIEDLSVLDYVQAQTSAQAANKALETNDMSAMVAAATEVVKIASPKFPVEEIGKMNHRQIIAFITLVFDAYPDAAAEAKAAATDAGGDSGNA